MLILCSTSANEQAAEDTGLDILLRKIAAGDTVALEALYHQTNASVYGFALSILKNTHDAEDVLHDCYVAICTAAADYRPHGKPMAWILTIARNLCLQKLREHRRRSDLPLEDWEPFLESREGLTPEDRLVLAACMEHLTDGERQIVVLHAVAGFKHREIAALMGLALPTVLSKYHRALKKLRQYL